MNSFFQTELQNWAIVSYNDDTGLGRMAADARSVLGIGHQLVAPSARLSTKPLTEDDSLLGQGHEALREFLSDLDGIIVLEKADWTPDLLPIARELGLAIVVVPMWEWFRGEDPLWRLCDLFLCPNRKCFDVLSTLGFENKKLIPWALDLSRFPARNISGPGRHFIHNAGLVDTDDRKGTREVIQAFQRARSTEIRLTVRMQREAALPKSDDRIRVCVGNLPDVSDLWSHGDVAIQPSKLEGIGFNVLEPICAGLPVITLDAPPMNEYPAGFRVKPRWLKRKAFSSNWVPHAHLRMSSSRHLTDAIERATQIDLAEISKAQRAWAEAIFEPDELRRQWKSALLPLVKRSCARL